MQHLAAHDRLLSKPPMHEPHKIKTVRLLAFPTLEERKKYLSEAHFNVFHITPSQITFDMCSKGMSAVSQEQLSGLLLGDEAYAGARNFEELQNAVTSVLRHNYVCPIHNTLGGWKLISATMLAAGSDVVSNASSVTDALVLHNIHSVNDRNDRLFPGNANLDDLGDLLKKDKAAFVYMEAFADGLRPFSLSNLRAVSELARKHGKPLILDGSRVVENAWYIQKHEPAFALLPIAEVTRKIVETSTILLLDGSHDAKCTTGGILTTNSPDYHEQFINQVVVYEGLHTYGGMAGRTMEMLARGLQEMCDEAQVQWIMHQTARFTERLWRAGVPLKAGCGGAYLDANAFLSHISCDGPYIDARLCLSSHHIGCDADKISAHNVDATLSAALYYVAGIRAGSTGKVETTDGLVPVQIPRLAMTNRQLDQVADAIIALYKNRELVHGVQVAKGGLWRDQVEYKWVFPDIPSFDFDVFPFAIHTIEKVAVLSTESREQAMRDASYNTFLLKSKDVSIDLLTDSGTSSMSLDQWAAYSAAKTSASTSDAYKLLVMTLQDILGYKYIIPTHQGRAAEQILSEIMIKPGHFVPGNMYFTTTKLHQELAGGVFADVIVDEAHDPSSSFPWKGNIDIRKLDTLVQKHGADHISYISFEHAVNMAGGQPVSMKNMKDVYEFCVDRGIPVFFDSTRAVENACMIQERDPQYHHVKIRDILREMMLYGDGCTISGKKDFLINIGGCLAFRDNHMLAEKAEALLRCYEGTVADGGLATSDLAAMARGCEEMLDDRYIRSRIHQTQFLGELLMKAGVPIVLPCGGHAVFLDAKRFLPHIDQDEFPAQRLAAEIYIETGVRAMERGTVSKGRNPVSGENYHPSLDLVRLTIPRRVYTNDHIRAVAEGIIRLYERRDGIRGLRFVYEPAHLRFFQARFESL